MRAVIQRVSEASVTVDGEVVGAIGPGLCVLLGAGAGDGEGAMRYVLRKVLGLRVFEDDDGRMSRSLEDTGGQLLVVSQFTVYGDCRKGRRPSFVGALEPVEAERLVDLFVAEARGALGDDRVATGRFRADMAVALVNDGPVTLLVDSAKTF